MNSDSENGLISKKEDQKILKLTGINYNVSEVIPFRNIQEKKIQLNNSKTKKIVLNKIDKKREKIKNYINNPKYKILIEKIAKKWKHRVTFPKCKIFKFYLSYRILILRIADGIKKTAKKLIFWENWEKSITEQKINQKQEIASTACKKIEKGSEKKIL